MTPEECARLVLSDGQDPVLRAKADRENEADLAEALKDPAFKARWDANLKAFAEEIDAMTIRRFYAEIYGKL